MDKSSWDYVNTRSAGKPQTTTATKKLEPLLLEESGHVQQAVDRGNYVFLMFMLFGFGALLPWNMFLNISHDYYTKFKLLGDNSTVTWESNNFQNSMTIAAQIPNLMFSAASIFLAAQGDLTRRMRYCLAIVQAMVAITIIFIFVQTTTWTTSFFWLTILTIFVLNAANGLFQNSLFGLASSFPFKYTNAILIGQNFCGIAVTALAMLTKWVAANDVQRRAMLYFGLSSIAIIACFFLLNVIKKLTFFKVHDVTEANAYDDFKKEITTWEDVRIAFSESKMQFVNIFLLFFVTLSLFPNICMYVRDVAPPVVVAAIPAGVASGPIVATNGTTAFPPETSTAAVALKEGAKYNFVVDEEYFMDYTTFLNFNLFAFIGSLTANWVRSPGPRTIWIAVVARFWFMFYFPFANYFPEDVRALPVLFESTWFFVFNVTILAFSSGYLSSLIMMYAPRYHEEPRIQRMAGMIAAFFLVAGVVAGLIFSWPIKLIVTGFKN